MAQMERYSDFKKIITSQFSEENWCSIHQRYNCGHHHRSTELPAKILKAMQDAAAEEQTYEVRIFPMYPHDVLVYLEEEYWRHISNIRRHMAAMAQRGMIKRLGQRKGYALL